MSDLDLARECGGIGGKTLVMDECSITAFADRIRQQERKECAHLCDVVGAPVFRNCPTDYDSGAMECASVIRSQK